MRIKLEYTPNCDVQVMSQLINDNDTFKFRPWNPKDIYAPIGRKLDVADARSWFCTLMILKQNKEGTWKDYIDEIRTDGASPSQIFEEAFLSYNGESSNIRIMSWILNSLGHMFLSIVIPGEIISKIPLSRRLGNFRVPFCLIWCAVLQFFIIGIVWIYFRPRFGIGMLAIFSIGFFFITLPYDN